MPKGRKAQEPGTKGKPTSLIGDKLNWLVFPNEKMTFLSAYMDLFSQLSDICLNPKAFVVFGTWTCFECERRDSENLGKFKQLKYIASKLFT